MLVKTPRELGVVVRARREEVGWTQQQLADQMRATRWWVNQFEAGKGTAQMGLVLDALNVLGLQTHILEAEHDGRR